jgi:hypothetical protein
MNQGWLGSWYGLAVIALVSIVVMQAFFSVFEVVGRASNRLLYKESLDERRSRALRRAKTA